MYFLLFLCKSPATFSHEAVLLHVHAQPYEPMSGIVQKSIWPPWVCPKLEHTPTQRKFATGMWQTVARAWWSVGLFISFMCVPASSRLLFAMERTVDARDFQCALAQLTRCTWVLTGFLTGSCLLALLGLVVFRPGPFTGMTCGMQAPDTGVLRELTASCVTDTMR